MEFAIVTNYHDGTGFHAVPISDIEVFGAVRVAEAKVAGNLDVALEQSGELSSFTVHADTVFAFSEHTGIGLAMASEAEAVFVLPEDAALRGGMADTEDSVEGVALPTTPQLRLLCP